MKILFQYTKRILLANKGRTAMTICGIVLTFALLTAVITAASSFIAFYSSYFIDNEGDYYADIYELSPDEAQLLAADKRVTKCVTMDIVGTGFLNEDESASSGKRFVFVGGMNDELMDTLKLKLTEGRLPENENELLVPEKALKNGFGHEIGDEVVLSLGSRVETNDNSHRLGRGEAEDVIVDEKGAVTGYSDTIIDAQDRRYVVVGTYETTASGDANFASYLFLTRSKATGSAEAFVKTTDADSVDAVVYELFPNKAYSTNRMLLSYIGKGGAAGRLKAMIYSMCAVLAVIIAGAGISLIYNSFSISVGERTKQYGLFRSIGATRFQVRISVFMEAGILCLISIPLGLIVGCIGVAVVLSLLGSSFEAFLNVSASKFNFHTEPAYLAAAVLAGIATVFISALIPAARANRITPIEGIRQSSDIKISRKDARKYSGSGIAGKLFGIGGLLAHRNIKRNKKPYRAISISLATSLFLFLGCGGFVYYLDKTMDAETSFYSYDATVTNGSSIGGESSIDIIQKTLGTNPAVKELAISTEPGNIDADIPEDALTDVGKQIVKYYGNTIGIRFINDAAFKNYAEKLGLDASEYMDAKNPKAILLNRINCQIWGDQKKTALQGDFFKGLDAFAGVKFWRLVLPGDSEYYNNEDGSIAVITGYDESGQPIVERHELSELRKDMNFSVGYCAGKDELPFFSSESNSPTLLFSMSVLENECFAGLAESAIVRTYIVTDDINKVESAVLELQKSYGEGNFMFSNINEQQRMVLGLYNIVNVLLTCFTVLVCMITAANIANTIATSVRLRTREYAMMKAVGISRSTFLSFIVTENLSYTIKGCIIGVILGLTANYFTYRAVQEYYDGIHFLPTPYYIAGMAAIVIVLLFSVTYTWKRVRRGNICDELRKESL